MSNNGNQSFKGVGRYMFTSNKLYTQRLSVTENTHLASVTVTDGLTITDGGLSVTGNTSHGPSSATLGFYGKAAVARPAAIANASDATNVIARLNDLLAAARALGLIATA
jgi:hypothetical protein